MIIFPIYIVYECKRHIMWFTFFSSANFHVVCSLFFCSILHILLFFLCDPLLWKNVLHIFIDSQVRRRRFFLFAINASQLFRHILVTFYWFFYYLFSNHITEMATYQKENSQQAEQEQANAHPTTSPEKPALNQQLFNSDQPGVRKLSWSDCFRHKPRVVSWQSDWKTFYNIIDGHSEGRMFVQSFSVLVLQKIRGWSVLALMIYRGILERDVQLFDIRNNAKYLWWITSLLSYFQY